MEPNTIRDCGLAILLWFSFSLARIIRILNYPQVHKRELIIMGGDVNLDWLISSGGDIAP